MVSVRLSSTINTLLLKFLVVSAAISSFTLVFFLLVVQESGQKSDNSMDRPLFPKLYDFSLPASNESKKAGGWAAGIRGRLAANRRRNGRVPKRRRMGACPPLFGRVGVFVAVSSDHDKRMYAVAQASLQCYLNSTNYSYFYVDVDRDERTRRHCNQTQMMFRRHCAAAEYLRDVDWLLVLDADTGVVNPNHCVEEWIDDRVDMIFYERFFHVLPFEIAGGIYLVRNTRQSREFLLAYANTEDSLAGRYDAADNGQLLRLILATVVPEARAEIAACDALYRWNTGIDSYFAFVTCVKVQLGVGRMWPGVLRILRRAHSWVRDGYLLGDVWGPEDFMFHGWKSSDVRDVQAFSALPDLERCGTGGLNGWHHAAGKRVTTAEMKRRLAAFERVRQAAYPHEARVLLFLARPEVAHCYPDCEALT